MDPPLLFVGFVLLAEASRRCGRPRRWRWRRRRAFPRGRACRWTGSISKEPGQIQFLGDLLDGGDDLFAHEAEAAHGVLVGHGAVAVPEEDAAGAQVLEDVADLGDDGLGSTGDDGVVGDLLFVGAAENTGRAGGAAASGGGAALGGQDAAAGVQARQVDQRRVGGAFVTGQEGVARSLGRTCVRLPRPVPRSRRRGPSKGSPRFWGPDS